MDGGEHDGDDDDDVGDTRDLAELELQLSGGVYTRRNHVTQTRMAPLQRRQSHIVVMVWGRHIATATTRKNALFGVQ